jgi:hypothetical protein
MKYPGTNCISLYENKRVATFRDETVRDKDKYSTQIILKPNSFVIKSIHMEEISRLVWLIGVVKHAKWELYVLICCYS